MPHSDPMECGMRARSPRPQLAGGPAQMQLPVLHCCRSVRGAQEQLFGPVPGLTLCYRPAGAIAAGRSPSASPSPGHRSAPDGPPDTPEPSGLDGGDFESRLHRRCATRSQCCLAIQACLCKREVVSCVRAGVHAVKSIWSLAARLQR